MTTELSCLPCPELIDVLLPAYRCSQFEGGCAGVAKWDPEAGFVPRGFLGALGRLEDVKLVLLIAEPGNGMEGETYRFTGEARPFLEDLCRYVFDQYENNRSDFHANMRYVLDRCWPGLSLREQLTRTWITETFLCSAPFSTGPVKPRAWRTCVDHYLSKQLELLSGRVVIALGGKAQTRAARLGPMHHAFAPGKPGANFPGARPSWEEAGRLVQEAMNREA